MDPLKGLAMAAAGRARPVAVRVEAADDDGPDMDAVMKDIAKDVLSAVESKDVDQFADAMSAFVDCAMNRTPDEDGDE